jgi:hypothetical protein
MSGLSVMILKGEKQKPNSFHDNPFAGSPEQVKLDPDK